MQLPIFRFIRDHPSFPHDELIEFKLKVIFKFAQHIIKESESVGARIVACAIQCFATPLTSPYTLRNPIYQNYFQLRKSQFAP